MAAREPVGYILFAICRFEVDTGHCAAEPIAGVLPPCRPEVEVLAILEADI